MIIPSGSFESRKLMNFDAENKNAISSQNNLAASINDDNIEMSEEKETNHNYNNNNYNGGAGSFIQMMISGKY